MDDEFICPYCGETGGDPVYVCGEESRFTGYTDEFEGCTLCAPRFFAGAESDVEARRRAC